jgi:site-specific recombinase XerD
MKESEHLLQYVQRFFQDYLRTHRGMSPNTVLAYRDAMKLFLLFLTSYTGRQAARLSLDHLTADAVLAFLGDIETKGNSVTTRNLRLSALRTFFSYLVTQDTLRTGQYQRVIAIPLKQSSHPLMDYLDVKEVKAILQSIDQKTPVGSRDYVLISLFYNTGARVQEVCDLRIEHILDLPPSVIVTGKGQKTRQVPLWPETASILKQHKRGETLLKESS